MRRFLVLFLLSVLLAPAQQFSKGNWQTDRSKKSIDLNDLKLGGPPKDGIPAIREPEFVSAEDAASWVAGREPVIVVELGGEARAYPLQILVWHEMVADQIGDVPLLVTYCPLCNSSIAFDRRVDGQVYDFGVSGMLRHSDMIMFDRQTDSLWQQLTGEAVVGNLTGKKLDIVTSQVVDFASFAKNFPSGKVLGRPTGHNRPYGSTPYAGYEQAGRVMFPALVKRPIGPPLQRVVSFTLEGKSRAYTFGRLRQAGVVDGKIKKTRYVVFYDGAALSTMEQIARSRQVGSAGVFSPELDGTLLKFRFTDGKILDKGTGSTWNVLGMATDGALTGQRLKVIPHGVFYAFAWMAFAPKTDLIGVPVQRPAGGFSVQQGGIGSVPGAGGGPGGPR